MEQKTNSYLKSYTGHKIDPLNPKKEQIELRDIAHALSLLCRGNGQVTHFYSVAQHCINCSLEAKERGESIRIQFGCLLHDASESYLSDVIRPIKQHMPVYYEIEDKFLNAVFEKFGLSDLSEEEKAVIKEIDDCLLDYDLVELLKEEMPAGGYQFVRIPDVSVRPFEEVEEEYYKALYPQMLKQF